MTISIYSKTSKKIHDFFRVFSEETTKPQLGNLREMANGLILGESIHLSHIGEKVSREIRTRKVVERFSNTLNKVSSINLQKRHILSQCQSFGKERKSGKPILIIPDGGDIQKPNAEKIENLCGNVDGSNGHKKGWGFSTIGIVAYGTESKKTIPLVHHLYSSRSKEFKGAWGEHRQFMDCLYPVTQGQNAIVVEDRIGDDKKRINHYLHTMGCSFIVRLSAKRKFNWEINKETHKLKGIEIMDYLFFNPQDEKLYKNTRTNEISMSKIAWAEVKHEDVVDPETKKQIPLFLVIVKNPTFKEPIIVLTDIKPRNIKKAWELFFFYKKRWEVEKFFRNIKQSFKLESSLLMKYKSWQTMCVLVMFAWLILQKIKKEFNEFLGSVSILFKQFIYNKQEKEPTELNILHFIRDLFKQYQPARSHHFYRWKIFLHRLVKDKNQLSLFNNSRKMVKL